MRSMTGFGKAKKSNERFELSVEIRSVNNRFLDLSIRLPKELSVFENKIREKIKADVKRGKLSVFVSLNEAASTGSEILLSQDKVKHRFEMLKKVRESLNIKEPVSLNHLLNFSDLFEFNIESVDEEEITALLYPSLEEALQQFNDMREAEGAHLIEDMKMRIKNIYELSAFVEKKGKLNVSGEFDKLLTRVKNLIDEQKIDKERLEQEIAIMADRVDITEECVRMNSHIKLFNKTIENNDEAGKKLTFILQEMLRESNTMNSKTSDIEISHRVIRIKEDIEKLREQAQNLE
jgi:uncharacterized protein (TIGR00255 family)